MSRVFRRIIVVALGGVLSLLTLSVFAGSSLRPIHAANIYNVTTLDDTASPPIPGSFRDAIAQVDAGNYDTIDFSVTGTIYYMNIGPLITKNVTIIGPGAALLTINGGNYHDILTIFSPATVHLSGVTIANGREQTYLGGGIHNEGTLTVADSAFVGNSSIYTSSGGGAIFNATGASLTVTDSTFTNNSAGSGYGGAIYNAGTFTATNDTFSGNSAYDGGAIYNANTLTITNATIANNLSLDVGGAIINYGQLSITGSTLTANQATLRGGAIYNDVGGLTIVNSSLSGNMTGSGGGAGGALFNYTGFVTVTGSTVSGNSARSGNYGGAIYNGNSLAIANSTLSDNTIPGQGGAIYNAASAKLLVAASTFSGNSAASGGGIYNSSYTTLSITASTFSGNSASTSGGGFYNIFPSTTSVQNTIVTNSTNGDCVTANTGTLSGNRNFGIGCPDDLGVLTGFAGVLADNGGPTYTIALLPASNARDAALTCAYQPAVDFAASIFDPTKDQRGMPRPFASACDIGAFEYIPPPTPTPTVTASLTNTATSTATPTATPTATVNASRIDTIGVYRGGTYYLRLANSTGFADITVAFNPAAQPYPIVGDWSGTGVDTVGVFDQSDGMFWLCIYNDTTLCSNGANVKRLALGVAGDMPLAGRWQPDMPYASVGVFRPSNGLIYLKNVLRSGYADETMVLGLPGDIGLAGDWTGQGYDSPGVYRPSLITFYLSNQVTNGSVFGDEQLQYGYPSDVPVVGDWIGQGHDGVGLFRPSNGYTYLKNALTTGFADNTFVYGIAGDIPVAGHWRLITMPQPQNILIPNPQLPTTVTMTQASPRATKPDGGFDG